MHFNDYTFYLMTLSTLLMLVFGYAEIHYRLPGIPSRLFIKEPEIIFDLPHRCQIGNSVPLFLFIKDAHLFSLKLISLEVTVQNEDRKQTGGLKTGLGSFFKDRFISNTFSLPAAYFPQAGYYSVSVELIYQVNGKQLKLKQDNYKGISHKPFYIYISDNALPSLPNLYWGDLHLHSNYTDDQIEFGAPIRETALCAKALGLKFMAVTDHSYDLDDCLDDYSKQDPDLNKWRQFLLEVETVNKEMEDFTILGGEEVSAGNHKNQNVHCLVLGSRTFYPGSGDSGEKPLSNHPTLSLLTLLDTIKESGAPVITAAAHPFNQPPRAHRIVLNRGTWSKTDLSNQALDYWQLLNGCVDDFFYDGLTAWIESLLNGHKTTILAGTDAHGSFNCSRQISIPFFKMVKSSRQLLGQTRTGIISETPLTSETLIRKLKEKRVVISNGPAGILQVLQNGQNYQIGDTINKQPFTLKIDAVAAKEFGRLKSVALFIGNYENKTEAEKSLSLPQDVYKDSQIIEFSRGLPGGYFRLVVKTTEDSFCLTNPIWIE